ncbi:cupin-like domain-containing protein [Novosphingobium sp. BL-8H]|uniref:cupin-like domain-containing protein n=1 Tax=Novosphingobium sp. BL-8H TaxID=3127640 RepID=UPI0037564D07
MAGGNDRLDAALKAIGLGGLDAMQPYTGGPRGGMVNAAVEVPDAVAAARRDWIMQVQERQRRLSVNASALMRCRDLPGHAFLDHFYAPGRPVVIEGAIAHWPALARWTPDYLAGTVGSAEIEYQGGRDGAGDFELAKDRHKRRMAFDAFVAMIVQGQGNDAYITAYNSGTNAAAFAPLMADVMAVSEYLTPDPGMLWVGPAGTFTPLHFDLTNNLLIQITGRKQVRLVPPSQTRLLYNHRHVFSAVHDLDDPARLDAHPLAKQVESYDVTLEPGDMLYIPIGWWHQVRSLDFSVMMTCTNFLWPNLGHEEFPEG